VIVVCVAKCQDGEGETFVMYHVLSSRYTLAVLGGDGTPRRGGREGRREREWRGWEGRGKEGERRGGKRNGGKRKAGREWRVGHPTFENMSLSTHTHVVTLINKQTNYTSQSTRTTSLYTTCKYHSKDRSSVKNQD